MPIYTALSPHILSNLENGCPNPEESGGGQVPYGVSLEFFCTEGMTLSGPSVVTCLETGKFDHPIPECLGWYRIQQVCTITIDMMLEIGLGKGETGRKKKKGNSSPLSSPMIIGMLAATGLLVTAIGGLALYSFVFA